MGMQVRSVLIIWGFSFCRDPVAVPGDGADSVQLAFHPDQGYISFKGLCSSRHPDHSGKQHAHMAMESCAVPLVQCACCS